LKTLRLVLVIFNYTITKFPNYSILTTRNP
jgi:hypothetical protein